jgi:DNA repair photolyase
MPGVQLSTRAGVGVCLLPGVRMERLRMTELFPTLESASGTRSLAVLEERRRGTRFFELPVRSIINAPESTGMGFWSINPYVGCEYGCTYCYARFAHRYVVQRARDDERLPARGFDDHEAATPLEPFEHRIFVKTRHTVLAALERDLQLVRRRAERDGTQSLLIGTGTDPYQPAERQYQLTRAVLNRLLRERDMRIGIITKSPLVVRDVEFLSRLTRRHEISVYISLVSADAHITERFEARSPVPHVRLRALGRLRAAGIRAGLIVAPVLPGISDTTRQLHALMQAAREADAQFVFPSPLHLYAAVRQRTLTVLERHYPHLVLRYQAAYRRGCDAPPGYRAALIRRFERIAAAYGIPATDGSREQPRGRPAPADTQLSLFARSA